MGGLPAEQSRGEHVSVQGVELLWRDEGAWGPSWEGFIADEDDPIGQVTYGDFVGSWLSHASVFTKEHQEVQQETMQKEQGLDEDSEIQAILKTLEKWSGLTIEECNQFLDEMASWDAWSVV